ncbi:hypothetical protein MGALJ_05040 [Mycobacterium gallinarum]|uniref:Uncharacterized protein n=1 Tax=Mycobacterium gallinarum TaxID=39689 RepID=A0A9W4FDD0_9MYCO|nr:hypothetical protein [Mycobacterium gallinarum]BBY90835.1 hypothetical protein MGALJ_05040 [Mycobacterium gallinarum]
MRVALDKADGWSFEHFVNDFYASIGGESFSPLGGLKDGGADGYDEAVYESRRNADVFYQSSIEKDVESKIRKTVARLREFGRQPCRLVHFTSQTVRYTDKVEAALSTELNVTITIRDGGYIASHVNDGAGTIAAFDQHLRSATDFLKGIGTSNLLTPSSHVKSPAVYVFLAQELNRRDGDYRLVDAMTDALIIWALEGTDPDAGILVSAADILQRIVADLPAVELLVAPRLDKRLDAMASKDYPGGRAIRSHRKEGTYCLPFETRQRVEADNFADEALRVDFRRSIEERVEVQERVGLGDETAALAVDAAVSAIQSVFEHEGLEFARYLHSQSTAANFPTILGALTDAVADMGIGGRRAALVVETAFCALRGVFYDSLEVEREYLRKLSRTYALLFTLQAEPRLIEFFQDLVGDFYLYVGSDVIVRALSEHLLPEPDQMMRNTLLAAARHGATLVLAEPVLEEVVHHLRACDHEYRNHIAGREHHMSYELMREVPHIMLRAYLYAFDNQELGARRPRSWQSFVKRFCDPEDLQRAAAYTDLRAYLCAAFNLQFRSSTDLARYVDHEEAACVAAALADEKKNDVLAHNDATMAVAVYGRRTSRRENARSSEFGLNTWWLTSEASIVRHTKQLVERNGGTRYMMRPDFLLNFLTLAPRAADVRRTMRNVFPSLLGVSLSRRIDRDSFHEVMKQVDEAMDMDHPRRTAKIAKIADKLKGDMFRQFAAVPNGNAVDRAAAKRAGVA